MFTHSSALLLGLGSSHLSVHVALQTKSPDNCAEEDPMKAGRPLIHPLLCRTESECSLFYHLTSLPEVGQCTRDILSTDCISYVFGHIFFNAILSLLFKTLITVYYLSL